MKGPRWNRDVEKFHERRERDRERDDPWIDDKLLCSHRCWKRR